MTGPFSPRHAPVSASQHRLAIEMLLAGTDDDLLAVMRRSAEQPETRVIGVVDASGLLTGVLPVVRLAEAVIARVTPEALLTDISDMVDVTRFGQAIGARVVREVMVEPAAVAPHGDPRPGLPPDARASPVRRLRRRLARASHRLPRPSGAGAAVRRCTGGSATAVIGLAVDLDVVLAALIFVVTYGLIATERIDKTIAALLGGAAVVILRVISTRRRRSRRSTSTSSSCLPG